MTKNENDDGMTTAVRRAKQKSVSTSPTHEETRAHAVGTPTTFEPIAMFEEAVAFTRERSPASFDQWFSGVQFDSLVDGVLSLRARDEFVREWVDDHFMPTLTDFYLREDGVEHPGGLDHRRNLDSSDRGSPAQLRPGAPPGASTSRAEAPTSVQLRASAPPPPPTSGTELPAERSSGVHPVTPPPPGPVGVAPALEGLNPKHTFANFVVGPSNQLAHAARSRPLAGRADGTTRSSSAAGRALARRTCPLSRASREARRPSARIVYISAEQFVNDFVQAPRTSA